MAKLGKYYGRPVKAVYIGTGGTPIEYAPVVRCKDCKHFSSDICYFDFGLNFTRGDEFCSYGERKDNE